MKIILIGTSPAMLIEAILLRQQFKNAKIEIHDKKKHLEDHGQHLTS